MTTIVFDGHYLAADTRGTLGFASAHKRHCPNCGLHIKHSHTELKKIHIPDKRLMFEGEVVIAMAGAGSSNMFNFMIYLVETHPEPNIAVKKFPGTAHQEHATLLILTEQNVYELTAGGRLIKHRELPVAIGTGALAARLAIKEGSNAMDAVRKAALVDPGTNNVIDFIKVVPSEHFIVERYIDDKDKPKTF